jgi:hypothetical protein
MRPPIKFYSIAIILLGLTVILLAYIGSHGKLSLKDDESVGAILIFAILSICGIANLLELYFHKLRILTLINAIFNLITLITLVLFLIYLIKLLTYGLTIPILFPFVTTILIIFSIWITWKHILRITRFPELRKNDRQ